MNRTTLLVGAVAVLVAALVGVAVLVQPLAGPVQSEYDYSVTVATNATLSNVTLYLPIPATDGDSPLDVAFEGTAGSVSIPDGWRAEAVETDHGPMLRVTTAGVPTRLHSDGHAYETYTLQASVPADHEIDTRDPIGTEPLLRPSSGFEAVPCPNQGPVPSRATCHVFESRLYVRYDAPDHADVDVFVVFGGANDFGGGRGNWYSERIVTRLEGARDGWVEVSGDLQAGSGSS